LRVVLFKGASQYDVLRGFIDEIAAAFTARGDTAEIVDLTRMRNDRDLEALLARQRPADLAFSFMIMGNYRDRRGRTVSQIIEAPHVVQYVDYPLSHGDRFIQTASDAALLLVDPSHIDAICHAFGPKRFPYAWFSPHAGLGAPHPLPSTAHAFAAERPIRVLFAGSFYRAEEPPWRDFPDDFKQIYAEAAERMLAQEWLPPHEALERVLRTHGIAAPFYQPDELQTIRILSAHVLQWVRQVRRQRFFETAARVGLKLTVCGNGYDGELKRYPNVEYLGPRTYAQTIDLMRQTRLAVSVTSVFGQGSHERPLTAMLAGAAAASDWSEFFALNFTEDREIALFRWMQLEEDLYALRELAENPAKLFDMAAAGQAKAARSHRWANRIDAFVAAAGAVRAGVAPDHSALVAFPKAPATPPLQIRRRDSA
jgi:hypothetical protein